MSNQPTDTEKALLKCKHDRDYFFKRAIWHESQHFDPDRAGREAKEDLLVWRDSHSCNLEPKS